MWGFIGGLARPAPLGPPLGLQGSTKGAIFWSNDQSGLRYVGMDGLLSFRSVAGFGLVFWVYDGRRRERERERWVLNFWIFILFYFIQKCEKGGGLHKRQGI